VPTFRLIELLPRLVGNRIGSGGRVIKKPHPMGGFLVELGMISAA